MRRLLVDSAATYAKDSELRFNDPLDDAAIGKQALLFDFGR
jgi:hypothetical protein